MAHRVYKSECHLFGLINPSQRDATNTVNNLTEHIQPRTGYAVPAYSSHSITFFVETGPSYSSSFLYSSRARNLLLILISLLSGDVVEAELVNALGGGDNAKPVTELLLLEVLLGPAGN
jgi:hypothetical protein